MEDHFTSNLELARIFEEIALLLEIKGENPFKVRAYRRAAEAVSLLAVPVREAVESGEIASVDGIGRALAAKIAEWAATGKVAYREQLAQEVPPGLIDVMRVSGIGPKTAKRLYDELGVTCLADLAKAVQDGRIGRVRGMGPKAQANIARALALLHEQSGRIPLGEAAAIGVRLVERLKESGRVTAAELAGSARRRCETVGDLDIVAAAENPQGAIEWFAALPEVREVLAKGETKCSVVLQNGAQADLLAVLPGEFASALHHFTGSKEHHEALRALAKQRGYSVSERGLKELATGEVVLPQSEEELYRMLGLPYIPPELREGRDEIELAMRGALPRLLELADIRGDLHVHTDWTDGRSSLADMARAAKALGREYIAICDHSHSLRVANGLSAADLGRQAEAIREVERLVGIRVLRGVEVDILVDGSLDLDDETLAGLDIVVASVHSHMNQDAETMTRRLVRAIENPHVDIIGHPTGRILGRRKPYEVDIDQVIEAAARSGTALEINASAARLDLKDTLAARAHAAGVRIAINTDAHDTGELGDMWLGVAVARRARLAKEAVVNAWALDDVIAWLGARNRHADR